jgi:hypothetical protein
MTDAPDSVPTPPDSPALRAAQQALDAALADPVPEPTDPGAGPTTVDSEVDLAARARRLEQAHQALAALLDEEPPGSSSSDDAEA